MQPFLWDRKTGRIIDPVDRRPTCSEEKLDELEEAAKDKAAVEAAVDVCSGTQSMKPVYMHRKPKPAYVALDEKVPIYSAALQKTVKNTHYDIMKTSPEETMAVIVQETKRQKPRTVVQRIKLGEVWISVPCNTYCKMGYINGEHQFRDKADPRRRPMKGTEKGKQAEEADRLVQKALLLIEYLAEQKAEQLATGVMMVVEGVEIDLRGMEWFLENPEGMLGMRHFMKQFEEEHEHGVVKLVVDYCAWDHYYMKPTNIWTSMLFWEPKGVQEDGVGRCRGRCKYGSMGEKGKWVHEHAIGQESSRVYGGEGRQTSKGAVPVDLHREIVRVRRAHYKKH